jgi:HK97 family phage major capsid protein
VKIEALLAKIKEARKAEDAEREKSLKAQMTELLKSEREAIKSEILQQVPGPSAAIKEAVVEGKGLKHFSAETLKRLGDQIKFMVLNSVKSDGSVERAKALSIGVGSAGGFLVPEEFLAEVLRKLIKRSEFRALARTFTGVGQRGSLPRETGSVSVTYELENTTTAETTNPALGQITWTLAKVKALTKLSQELVRFSAIDVLSLLSDMYAEAFEVNEDSVFMNGSGSNRPTGLRTNVTGMGTLAQAAASLNWKDLVNLKHKLPVQYREEAVFIAHNDVIAKISKLEDSQGKPLFLEVGERGTASSTLPPKTTGFVLGNPVVENNNIPTNLGGGSNESEIWFTNLKRGYAIFDGGTMEMSSSSEAGSAFEADQIFVKGIMFHDGKVSIPEASSYLSAVK